MKTLYLCLISVLAFAGTAYGQVPKGTWAGNDISDGSGNTGMGTNALFSVTPSVACPNNEVVPDGGCNTAAGFQALYSNTNGYANTAVGVNALYSNTTGYINTASGYEALYSNMSGVANTASGYEALYSNTKGNDNTAYGFQTLFLNSTGIDNTALGTGALAFNMTGDYNTASGWEALSSNQTGSNNTAVGMRALQRNASGAQNTASGVNALYGNTKGSYNTAYGVNALFGNMWGTKNTAIGWDAGYNLTTGSNNIDIGNQGVAGESNTIRIGTFSTQTAVYLAGAATGLATGGSFAQLSVNTSTGQIGIAPVSSERFKTGITPMGSATARLDELRPVTFQYKGNPQAARQYGLIAEEVAKVYPELVVRDAKGQILTVRYDELAPMLLNDAQQQAAKIRDLEQQVAEMRASLLKLQAKDAPVAQR